MADPCRRGWEVDTPPKLLRIVRNGNAAAVTIPRPVLHYTGFQLGDVLTCEVTEAREIIYRRVTARDLAPQRLHPYLAPDPEPLKP